MRKGGSLELAITRLFEGYKDKGIHCQQNHPKMLPDGTFAKAHGFDFQIFYQGRFIVFDAKECGGERIAVSNFKMHQIKAMYDVVQQGGEGFFLVYFYGNKKLRKFPVEKLIPMMEEGARAFSPDDMEETDIDLIGVYKNGSKKTDTTTTPDNSER